MDAQRRGGVEDQSRITGCAIPGHRIVGVIGGKQRINVDGRTLEVNVPAGIAPGQVIRLAGQGHRGPGRSSDLLLEVDYRPHGEFEHKNQVKAGRLGNRQIIRADALEFLPSLGIHVQHEIALGGLKAFLQAMDVVLVHDHRNVPPTVDGFIQYFKTCQPHLSSAPGSAPVSAH